jgi:hypothetical protein
VISVRIRYADINSFSYDLHIVFLHTTTGNGRSTETYTAGHKRWLGIVRYCILVAGDFISPKYYLSREVMMCHLQIGTCQGHLPPALGDWTLCCCSCWPLACPEGGSGWRMRHFVWQENWWNRSLDSQIFSGTDFMISFMIMISQSLHIFISRKAVNPFVVTSVPRD